MLVSDLFDIEYGQSLSLNKLRQVPTGEGVAFVSRTAKNNGVSAWVEPVPHVDPSPAGALTVCLRSRNYTLATFVQPRDFYTGYHVHVLQPKQPMDLAEKLWWAECIASNRYRYNFGRQANRTLAGLQLPDKVPDWVSKAIGPDYLKAATAASPMVLDVAEWKEYRLGDLFELARGRNVLKRSMSPGATAYVSASAENNGISAWISEDPDYSGGQITVSSNGSVGEAFFQPQPFVASGDVTVLVPKSPLTAAMALFVTTVIYADKYRWNYGRKWVPTRMRDSVVRLPACKNGEPDWERMAELMRGRPLYALLDQDAAEFGSA